MNHFLSVIALMAASAATAAPYSVKATILDAMTAESLPGATCSVYAATDSVKPILSGMAGANGDIVMELPSAGNYLMRVSMVGQKTVTRSFAITAENTAVNLGTIAMQPEGEAMAEVEVVGRRPVIEATGDKVSYNLTEDPSTQTHTVLEMLRKVPMVTVDAQDNILINGQSNFKIYLNGKEDPMLSQNASTVLKSLPATAIKRIEVILDPGAKYDAEGVGGILNIITETQASTDGQMATVTLRGGFTSASASLYGITKHNKVTASVDVSLYRNFPVRSADIDIYRETFNVADPAVYDQQLQQKQSNSFIDGNARISWEPNAANLFTLSASGYGGWGSQHSPSITKILAPTGNLISSISQNMKNKWTWSSLTINAGYQHNFDSKGQNMVLSYQYVHGWNSDKNYLNTTESSLDDFIPWTYDYKNSPTNEHTFQLDYTKPFSQYFTLEAGGKAILRRNSSDGYSMLGPSLSDLVMADYNDVDMVQNQDVAAAYATYAGTFGKFGLKAGLRYEFTHMGVKFHTEGYENFATDLNDWVPNASVSYSLTPTRNLYASYQQRIRRPGVDQLNPHRSEFIQGMVSMGNPDLTSEKSHTVALSYSDFSGKLGINLRTFYLFSNNRISQYMYEEGGTLISTFNNVGNEKNWGFSAFAKYQINALMDFSVNASALYTNLKYRARNMENHGWSFNAGLNYNYTMPWSVKMNAYGGFSTRRYMLQGHSSGWNYYGLSFSKAFMKNDRIKVTVSGSNFFSKSQHFSVYNADTTFANHMRVKMPMWDVNLSVAVTLGSLNSSVRRTSSQIQNDDVQQSQGAGASTGIGN